MNKHTFLKDPALEAEYKAFMDTPCMCAPECACQSVQKTIHQHLSPSWYNVLGRMLVIHIISVFLVLLVCPHFGVQLVPGFQGITPLFMQVGYKFCMVACGFLVIAPSFFSVVTLLQPEFLKPIKRHSTLILFGVTLMTFMCLALAGGQLKWYVDGPFWIIGALTGGGVSFALAMRIFRRPLLMLQH